ncbi:MAG TPA: acyltransferase family protein [Allosphingosinicella sp.]|nr:acyltransferase family protein [Allosphingosinicella sp.]
MPTRAAPFPYRADIDGLRAVAVLAVILFHAFPSHVPGGFLGVDVFFVISGFLITGLIVKRREAGTFTLADFYGQRARRLFPALGLVLLASLLAGALLLLASEYSELARQALSAVLFVPNFYFATETGYFDLGQDRSFLIHLWSLGVEEQFYLVWPLILLGCLRLPVRPAIPVALLTGASFLFCLWLTSADQPQAFYSPLARAWELGVGAILALSAAEPPRARASRLLSGAGLALIAAALFLGMLGGARFPGWAAAIPVAGTAMVIAAGPSGWGNVLLSWKPAVAIGLISYPLYLWHWPLLSFAHAACNFETPPLSLRIALLLAATILAWGTYRLVELPLRRARPATLFAGMAAIGCAALGVLLAAGLPDRPANENERRQFIATYRELRLSGLAPLYRRECAFVEWRSNKAVETMPAACTQAGAAGTAFLWGDSHAQALSWGLRRQLPPGFALAQVTTPGCPPAVGAELGRRFAGKTSLERACRRSNGFAVREIARLRPHIVFIAQRDGHDRRDWNAVGSRLRELGVRQVVVVGPVPRWFPSLPRIVTAHHWPLEAEFIATGLEREPLAVDRRMRERAPSPSFRYVSLIPDLCTRSGCRARAGEELLVVDTEHLSASGSLLAARLVAAQIWGRPRR